MANMTADDILTALIAMSDDKIWATELALLSGGRRIDFWTLEPAASRGFRACAFEIKVSRGDFKRDTDEKQDGALRFSDRFWYVTPPGLVQKQEVPAWAGLQEWDGGTFVVRKKAPMRAKESPSWDFVVSLLRNSGDARRDTSLMKSQIAFYQFQAERSRSERKIRETYTFERWKRRASTNGQLEDKT
jgi:hypothetical protein